VSLSTFLIQNHLRKFGVWLPAARQTEVAGSKAESMGGLGVILVSFLIFQGDTESF
jgi:hypothetical protein